MISTSSEPTGNSMLKVRLTEFVWVSVKVGSSPSTRIIKSSSASLQIESKNDLSNVISKVPEEPVTSTVKIKEIKSVSASIPETVISVPV